jgi:leader peptidase (prepilin peptidase)/N-methyltransferase
VAIGLLGAALNPERGFWEALGGVLMGGGFLWATAVLYYALRKQEGMGGGDIKLLAWIGAVLGWMAIPFVILVSSLIGTLVGVAMAFRKGKSLKEGIPFGPYLALSAILYIIGGYKLGLWYLRIFIPSL